MTATTPEGIKSVTLQDEYHGLKKGLKIELREGVNLLVGDQGCGKTSLLELISGKDEDLKMELHELSQNNGIEFVHFDTEKMNPRTKGELPFGGDMMSHIALQWSSHGEAMSAILMSKLDSFRGIVLIDEPESGLSIRSQYKLAGSFKKAAGRGCQLIVATHSIILMEAFAEVYSLEHKKWMKADEFIVTQKEPKAKKSKAKKP